MNTTCIIILNYNHGPKTATCIASVLDQTLQDFRLLIVDNESTDDSLEVITTFLEKKNLSHRIIGAREENPAPASPGEVLLVKSGRNGGYSYGNNCGIRLAQSMGIFSRLLILNNDLVLKEDFLREMAGRYEELREQHQTEKIALGATEMGEDGEIRHNGFHYIHLPSGITFASPVFPSFRYIVGSCIFAGIGAPLMDESFFLYFDDTQYSKILQKEGFILESSPRSAFIHEVGGSGIPDLQWMIFKSLRRFYFLNYPLLLPVVVPIRLMLIAYLGIKRRMKRYISY